MPALRVIALAAAAIFLVAAPATAEPLDPLDPMRFFEGRTETVGTIKLLLQKAYGSRSMGRGIIEPDGSLLLVQQVHDDGKPPRERRWRIRQISRGRFSGTMSEAIGPVKIDEVGGSYRFLFKMKGNFVVEQWLVPLAGGTTARNSVKVRKYGVTVGTSDGTIRKIAGIRSAGSD